MKYMTLFNDEVEVCRIDIAKVDDGSSAAAGDYEWCVSVNRDGGIAERLGRIDGVSTRIGELRLLHHVIGDILKDGRLQANKKQRGAKKPLARAKRTR